MLEKDKGDPKIDRLRIICLYEADYNIFLKIMWAQKEKKMIVFFRHSKLPYKVNLAYHSMYTKSPQFP
jgi:hypothetical protein